METSKSIPANLTQLDELLNSYFGDKAPTLPSNIKEGVVQYAPWIVLISFALLVPSLIGLIKMQSYLSGLYAEDFYGVRYGYEFLVSFFLSVTTAVFMLLSLKGLFAKNMSGWKFIFYLAIANSIGSILMMDLVSLVISSGVTFYLLYQVKSYYK